eukprot:TRINITY_DN1050_c0_g1_i1.p1 TRINITY_DN1050_c0_g1~~TRINITY_DN1050_c0_g1_i1.p1  ORF type:complete len:303 (+),score=83.46 TRINITY_DN1050_c0_g1_i1:292-1200(+)
MKENEVLNEEMEEKYKANSNEELHKILEEIDKEMSLKYHPNQRRKILRSIQIFQQNNKKQSELIDKQSLECKYDALIFWLGCENSILGERIKNRTQMMVDNGGLDEIYELNERLISFGYENYYKSRGGLLQSIGFKEFEDILRYRKNKDENNIKDDKDLNIVQDIDVEKKILSECIDKLNHHTIKYAKKQILWIKNRILTRDIPIYYLDTSYLDKWDQKVSIISKDIVHSFVNNLSIPHQDFIAKRNQKAEYDDKILDCEFCKKKIWGEFQINIHLKSKPHIKKRKKFNQRNNQQIQFKNHI